MKRKLTVAAFTLAFAVASIAEAQSLQRRAAEQELRQLDAAYYRNYLLMKKGKNRDAAVAFLQRIIADDYFSIGSDLQVGNKAQRLAVVRDLERTTESNRFSNVRVRIYGDTGVVHSDFEFRGTHKGKLISGRSHDIHWYQNRGDRWQQIAGHSIPQP